MNKPVTFEIAKLLKEKGFGLSDDDYIQLPRFYEENADYVEYAVHVGKKYNPSHNHLGADTIEDFKAHLTMIDNSLDSIYLAPTIAEVVMWLYKKHGIWIDVRYMDDILNFGYTITTIKDNTEQYGIYKFNYPQQAYSAAIDYILLNNII